jgi:hypothetical protein
MSALARLRVAVALGVLPLIALLGCSRPDGPARPIDIARDSTSEDSGAAPSPSPTPSETEVVYQLPQALCGMVDDSALKEIFPIDGGQPIADAPGLCATSRSSSAMAVGLSVDAELFRNGQIARDFFEMARATADSAPTELPGVGSGAFWFGGRSGVRLVAYHGNLALTIDCETVSARHQLPDDIAQRLGRVAAGTFARLAP